MVIPITGGLQGCDFDSMFAYTYFSIPGQGQSGPYSLDEWYFNGGIYSTVFANIQTLVNYMNAVDPDGNWFIDAMTFTIRGGHPANTYGMMLISQQGTNNSAELEANINLLPNGTLISLEPGDHDLVFEDEYGCLDSFLIHVSCDDPCVSFINLREKVVTSNDCENINEEVCIEIPFNEFNNYNITVNGNPYTVPIVSCNGGAGGSVIITEEGSFEFIFEHETTGCRDTLLVTMMCVSPISIYDTN